MRRNTFFLGTLLAAALAVPAMAHTSRAAGHGKLKQVATIAVAGKKINIFDISWVDQKTQRYYLADRTNGGVDIVDGRTDKYIGRITGFEGVKMMKGKPDYGISGPNGVLVYGNTAWAGDGDSTAKEIDLKTGKVVASVSTGGKNRCDELAYDPKNQVLMCGNGNDDPPFLTLISTKTRKVIAKLPFKNATDGIEAPAYNAADGLFYVSIPEFDHNPKKNGVALITPAGKLVKILPVEDCHPTGIVFGPGDNFLLGCAANGEEGMPPVEVVMNAKTGKVVARIPGAGGADEVAYSAKNQQYYVAGGDMDPSQLYVIDAVTNTLVQKFQTAKKSHSVAASDVTGKVFVPEPANGGCGCIRVFGPVK